MPKSTTPKPAKRRTRTSRTPEARAARWERQRQDLLHAAQRAIRRKGSTVAMEDVAAEAGITRPILYRHFGDRQGLARALRDAMIDSTMGPEFVPHPLLDPSTLPEEADVALEEVIAHLGRFFSRLVSFIEANPELYRFLRTEGMFDDKWEATPGEWTDPISESIGRALERAYAAHDVDTETARAWGYAIVAMLGGPAEWWAVTRRQDRLDLERAMTLMVRGTLEGLTGVLAPRRSSSTRRRRSEPSR